MFNPRKLAKKHRKAGLLSLGVQMHNQSYLCETDLSTVDKNSSTNWRDFDQNHSNKVQKEFCLHVAQPPILNYRSDGRLETINGRHTIDVLLSKGYKTAHCQVFFGLTIQEAARIFLELTVNSKRMSPEAAFNAAVAAEYPHAVAIRQMLDEFRFTTTADVGCGVRNAEIKSLSPLYEAYTKVGPKGEGSLRALFETLRAIEPNPNRKLHKICGTCEFLRGLLDAISELGTSNAKELGRMIARWGVGTLYDDASLYRKPNQITVNRSHYKKALLYRWNYGVDPILKIA
jgi:hypothetical protein